MIIAGIEWDTLEPLHKQTVAVKPRNVEFWAQVCSVRTVGGCPLEVWRILEGEPHERYNCHGFSLRTSEAPHGPFWIEHPEPALVHGFRRLRSGEHVNPSDLIVWWDRVHESIIHTAPIRSAAPLSDGIDAQHTLTAHKNGTMPVIENVRLAQFVGEYLGCEWQFWREK